MFFFSGQSGSRTNRNQLDTMAGGGGEGEGGGMLQGLAQPGAHTSFTYLEMSVFVPMSPDKLKLRGTRDASLVAYIEVLRGGSSTNVYTPVGISFDSSHANGFVKLTAGTTSGLYFSFWSRIISRTFPSLFSLLHAVLFFGSKRQPSKQERSPFKVKVGRSIFCRN